MSFSRFAAVMAVLLIGLFAFAPQARAASFDFDIVVNDTGSLAAIGTPSLNNLSQVAFSAENPSIFSVLRTSIGGSLDTIATVGQTVALDEFTDTTIISLQGSYISAQPTINDAGQVAFTAQIENDAQSQTRNSVFLGNGTTLLILNTQAAVLDVTPDPPDLPTVGSNIFSEYVSINSSGDVAYGAVSDTFATRVQDVRLGDTTSITLMTTGLEFTAAHQSPNPMTIGTPDINNSGQVAFVLGEPDPLNNDDLGGIVIRTSSVSSTLIGNPTGDHNDLGDIVDINNNGDVAFFVTGTGDSSKDGLYLGTGLDAFTKLNDIGDIKMISLNDNGDMVYQRTNSTLDIVYRSAAGVEQVLINTDDFLNGGDILYLDFWRDGLNNSGEIAFLAVLDYGVGGIRETIYLASQSTIPEPTSLALIGAGVLLAGARRRRTI